MWMSLPQMDAAATSRSTSPGPGCGTAISSSCAPGPGRVFRTARMVGGRVTRTGYFPRRSGSMQTAVVKIGPGRPDGMTVSEKADRRSGKRLAVAAVVTGIVEVLSVAILGVGGLFLLPLLGAGALVLGLLAIQRASLGQPTRGISIAAGVCA